MASPFFRSLRRTSLSPTRSNLSKSKAATATATCRSPSFSLGSASKSAVPSPVRRFSSFSRSPVELGCCGGSMYPLHSAVAAARLTSRLSSAVWSCRDLSQEIGLSVPR